MVQKKIIIIEKIDKNKGNGKMAFASSTINLNQLIPSLESLSVICRHLNKSLHTHNKYRPTINELKKFTDKDLADIGLCRDVINAVAIDSV